MAASSPVHPEVWTRRTAAISILRAVSEARTRSAERLEQAMAAHGKTNESLAYEAGVSSKTISRWRNAKHDPERSTVKNVARVLDVEPDWLWEPPAPLGLNGHGPTQLDRIENKLDALLTHLKIPDPNAAEIARAMEEAANLMPAPEHDTHARTRPARRTRRASR